MYTKVRKSLIMLSGIEKEESALSRVRDEIRNIIPDISDEKIISIMVAFDSAFFNLPGWEKGDDFQKINRIKKVLYNFIGDEEQTEKTFSFIVKDYYHMTFDESVKDEYPKADRLEFHFACNEEIQFTDSSLLRDFAEQNPDMSFALANAVIEYLDEKQHTERNNLEFIVGRYKTAIVEIHAVVGGERFNCGWRCAIGDGKDTGGGSLIDHIRNYNQNIMNIDSYPYNKPESKEYARKNLDVFIPFLEANSKLTAEEQNIFDNFIRYNPIRDEKYLRAKQTAEEQGIPFQESYSDGIDDEHNMYAYGGDMSIKDLRKMQLLNELDNVVRVLGREDDTPYRLIEAFENTAKPDWKNNLKNINEIKFALLDILNNEHLLTEKVYKAISDSDYIKEAEAFDINEYDDPDYYEQMQVAASEAAEQSPKEQAAVKAWHELGDAYIEAYEEIHMSAADYRREKQVEIGVAADADAERKNEELDLTNHSGRSR